MTNAEKESGAREWMYAMVDPKTPEDYQALWVELHSELSNVNEILTKRLKIHDGGEKP